MKQNTLFNRDILVANEPITKPPKIALSWTTLGTWKCHKLKFYSSQISRIFKKEIKKNDIEACPFWDLSCTLRLHCRKKPLPHRLCASSIKPVLSLHHHQPSPLIRDPDQTFKDQNKTKYSLFAYFLCQYCSSLLILGLAEKIFSFKKILTNMTTRYFHKGSLALAGRTSLSFPKRHICGVMKPLSPDTLFVLSFLFSHFIWCLKKKTGRNKNCMRGNGEDCFTELRKV